MKIKISEAQHQIALFSWARNEVVLKKYPELELMFAINNGLILSIGQAVKAKRMGTNKGILDILLPIPRKGFICLFIEMKTEGGRLSVYQKEKIEKLTKVGHKCVVCYSSKEAIDEILDYLKK